MLIEDVLTEFKRTHLEHIEDIVITDGHEGGRAVVEFFRGLLLTLKGTSSEAVKVSVKWDGAPAVVCGINPDNGKFFVGTKSVFAKAAKVNYTKKDIANNHGTDDLGQKLLKCLVHLKKLGMTGVYQGDLLFTDEDITRKNIDGKPNLTFTPNTITYAVPEQSDLGRQIDRAKVGIIFTPHTWATHWPPWTHRLERMLTHSPDRQMCSLTTPPTRTCRGRPSSRTLRPNNFIMA